jgi:hypothetical protein
MTKQIYQVLTGVTDPADITLVSDRLGYPCHSTNVYKLAAMARQYIADNIGPLTFITSSTGTTISVGSKYVHSSKPEYEVTFDLLHELLNGF